MRNNCIKCPDRWVNETTSCHSTCPTYQQFRKEAQETNAKAKADSAKFAPTINATSRCNEYLSKLGKSKVAWRR